MNKNIPESLFRSIIKKIIKQGLPDDPTDWCRSLGKWEVRVSYIGKKHKTKTMLSLAKTTENSADGSGGEAL